MFSGLGGLFGWLMVIGLFGTAMNYFVKLINKHYGKSISSVRGKSIMKNLMKVFVKNHRFFGGFTAILLVVHVGIQFSKYGFNKTGAIVAFLLIAEVCLGAYAIGKKRPRKGTWFVFHRGIALLLVLGVVVHVVAPYSFNGNTSNEIIVSDEQDVDVSALPILTLEELSQYNGEDGMDAYVAYKGKVYDVTNHPRWSEGAHNGNAAGTDLTDKISKSPHGESKFETLELVGTLNSDS